MWTKCPGSPGRRLSAPHPLRDSHRSLSNTSSSTRSAEVTEDTDPEDAWEANAAAVRPDRGLCGQTRPL